MHVLSITAACQKYDVQTTTYLCAGRSNVGNTRLGAQTRAREPSSVGYGTGTSQGGRGQAGSGSGAQAGTGPGSGIPTIPVYQGSSLGIVR